MLTNLLGNPDVIGVVMVSASTLVASVFSYFLQYLLGRFLSVGDFGTFTTFLSLMYILGVPAGVISISMTKKVSATFGANDRAKLTALYFKVLAFSLKVGALIFFGILLMSWPLKNVLRIDNYFEIIFFALLMSLCFLLSIPPVFLQGLLRYRAYSFYSVLSSFLRLAMPVALILAGYRVTGALAGISAAAIFSFLIILPVFNKYFVQYTGLDVSKDFKETLKYSVPVGLVTLCLIMMNNIDVVMIKAFFSSTEVGYYAGAVTLGKILLFGASTTSTMMLPKVSALKNAGKSYKKAFWLFFLLQVAIVSVGVCAFAIFPSFISRSFFGHRFDLSVAYIPGFAVFIGFYTLVNFLVTFFIAVDKTNISLILVPLVLIQVGALSFFHPNIQSVIIVNSVIAGTTLAALLIKVFRHFAILSADASFRNNPGL